MLLGLASSVDSVHTSLNLLLCVLENIAGMKAGCIENGKFDVQNNVQLTKDLLESVEGSLNHQKMSVMQGISQLKRLIKSKSKEQMLTAMPSLRNQKVDEYINDFQEKENQRLLLSVMGQNTDNDKTDIHHEQVEDLQQTVQSLREEIEKMALEKNIQIEENKKMNESVQLLLKEKAELETENAMVENESTHPGIFPVQLYYQLGGEQMASVVQDIMTMLNTQEQIGNQKLAFIRCENTADIQADLPLLALCMNTSRIGTDANMAIQGLQQLKNTALLIFHHKDEHALPSQSSDRVLTNSEFQALGGIFDMAFLAGRGVYHCETNTKASISIVAFIENTLKSGFK